MMFEVTGIGGGIYNNGPLTISNSTVSGNGADGGGNGIASNGGVVTITNSTLNNYAGGGGIRNSGTLQVKNTILYGTSAPTFLTLGRSPRSATT